MNAKPKCRAITRKGTQCQWRALPGGIFCGKHSFLKVRGTPWYYNAILLTILGIVAGVPISWYFGKGSATLDNQRLGLRNDEKILGILNKVELKKGPDLLVRYPFGYVLLTTYGDTHEHKHVIPSTSPVVHRLKIDWKKVVFERSPSNITLHIPEVRLETADGEMGISDEPKVLPRRVGVQIWGFIFQEAKMMVELVADDEFSSTVAFGFSPTPPSFGKVPRYDPPTPQPAERGILQQPLPDPPEPVLYFLTK